MSKDTQSSDWIELKPAPDGSHFLTPVASFTLLWHVGLVYLLWVMWAHRAFFAKSVLIAVLCLGCGPLLACAWVLARWTLQCARARVAPRPRVFSRAVDVHLGCDLEVHSEGPPVEIHLQCLEVSHEDATRHPVIYDVALDSQSRVRIPADFVPSGSWQGRRIRWQLAVRLQSRSYRWLSLSYPLTVLPALPASRPTLS